MHGLQEFPCNLDRPSHPDPENPAIRRGVSEVGRREKYFNLLQKSRKTPDQLLYDAVVMKITKKCLADEPENRPDIEEVLFTLQSIESEHKLKVPLFDQLELLRQVSLYPFINL